MRQCRYGCKVNYLREIANDIALWEILANEVFGNLNNNKKGLTKGTSGGECKSYASAGTK
jgi:hypothetical protein